MRVHGDICEALSWTSFGSGRFHSFRRWSIDVFYPCAVIRLTNQSILAPGGEPPAWITQLTTMVRIMGTSHFSSSIHHTVELSNSIVCRPFSSTTHVGPCVEDLTLCNTSPFGDPLVHTVQHGTSGCCSALESLRFNHSPHLRGQTTAVVSKANGSPSWQQSPHPNQDSMLWWSYFSFRRRPSPPIRYIYQTSSSNPTVAPPSHIIRDQSIKPLISLSTT